MVAAAAAVVGDCRVICMRGLHARLMTRETALDVHPLHSQPCKTHQPRLALP